MKRNHAPVIWMGFLLAMLLALPAFGLPNLHVSYSGIGISNAYSPPCDRMLAPFYSIFGTASIHSGR